MPADRFRPIKGSDFHGFRIPEDVKPPFAIVKSPRAKKLRGRERAPRRRARSSNGARWCRSPASSASRRACYYDEIEGGGWVADDELSRVDVAKKMPGWANEGEKWIDINVTQPDPRRLRGDETRVCYTRFDG